MKRTSLGLISVVAVMAIGCSSTEGDEDPLEESQEQLRTGRLVPEDEVVMLLRKYGFPERDIPRMVCTAKWESSFFEASVNNNRRRGIIVSVDRGLFQINSIHLGRTPGCPWNADDLWDADINARCAAGVYRAQGINAWYGYRAHRAECERYRVRTSSPAPVAAAPREADEEDLDQGPGCYSPTLQARVGERACVQSRASSAWFQCRETRWYRGGEDGVGPHGACVGSHGL